MPPDEQPPSQVEAARASMQLAFKILAQIGVLTVAVVVIALFGGLYLDRLLGTRPLFTVVLLLGSFPLSLYIIYRVALGAVAPTKPTTPGAAPRAKEDHSSDRSA
jgi:F0F1-type ATP synthase assembly protein I